MRSIDRGIRYRPMPARTPGGADHAVAVDEQFPPLPSADHVPGADPVIVGVVDCGITRHGATGVHPWFSGHLLPFRRADVDHVGVGHGRVGYLADADGHGTFVTGRILREAPRARVAVRGALDGADAEGAAPFDESDDERVTRAVHDLAHEPGLAVLNLSFGGGGFSTQHLASALGAALADLDPDVAVVAAAGNDGHTKRVWPAAFPGVIGVGAVDERRLRAPGATPARAPFSNHGPWVRAYATGVQVLGPFVWHDEEGDDGLHPFGDRVPQQFRGWARWSGTSFAAATVSGRIAQTAVELGVSGREAAEFVLRESRVIDEHGAVWVRSRE